MLMLKFNEKYLLIRWSQRSSFWLVLVTCYHQSEWFHSLILFKNFTTFNCPQVIPLWTGISFCNADDDYDDDNNIVLISFINNIKLWAQVKVNIKPMIS